MPEEQFYFSNETQDLLLACMAQYRSEFALLGPLVKPEYMYGGNARQVAIVMRDFYAEWGIYPSLDVVDGWFKEKHGLDKADVYAEVHEFIKELKKLDTANWKWVKSITLKFCRERALIVAIKKGAELVTTGKVPEGGFSKMFDEAMSVGRDFAELGICFADDVDKIVLQATDKTWGIKTGYPDLDEIWRNGWGPGWLISILAPPKSYKSTFCVNLALNICKKTNNPTSCPIFYYACEISAELTTLRGYSILSGIPLNKMYDDPARFITATKIGLGTWFGTSEEARNKHGLILLKSFGAKTATIADIRAHALASIEAFQVRPRVIVIDHAETIKISKRTEDASDYRSQADIYSDARALGDELHCVIIMPDRCTKETVQRPVPNMTSFQGSFEKAGIVDVAIGLCQTDLERAKNVIRYFVFVNRHGIQYSYFIGKVSENQFDMTIDSPIDYVQAVEEAEAAEKERKTLRRKAGRADQFFGIHIPKDKFEPER